MMDNIARVKEKVRQLMMEYQFIQGMEVQRSDKGLIIVLRVDRDTARAQRELLPKEILGSNVLIGEAGVSRYGPGKPEIEEWAPRLRGSNPNPRNRS